MKAVLQVLVILQVCTAALPAKASLPESAELHIRGGGDWNFYGGPWQEDSEGTLTPPKAIPPRKGTEETLAFAAGRAYGDFEAEFEFRHEGAYTDACFLFRAQDARRYYLVHFPCTGQQYRAKHFWAAISKVDGNGWVKILKMEMVHGVPSELGIWHKARLIVKGNEFRLWVDGRPFPIVTDDSIARTGHVGLASYATEGPARYSSFRAIRIQGNPARPPQWDKSIEPKRHWFIAHPTGGTGCSNIMRAPNGDLLVITWSSDLVRSPDNGRSWTSQNLSKELREGLLHTRQGRLNLHVMETEPPFRLRLASSDDSGRTWSKPRDVGTVMFPNQVTPANVWGMALLELQDGTLLRFAHSTDPRMVSTIKNGRRHLLVPDAAFNFCIRSTDGGQSWSKPVNIDGPNPRPQDWSIASEVSEVSAAQTRGGKVIALSRPYTSPWMWEHWSSDGGRTWAPAARGAFAMYACTSSMIRTASGAILIGGRHPGIAIQASFDDGMTWQCYRIDTTTWANGAMYEIKPDLVLYLYGGHFGAKSELRGQLIRVTPQGLQPADREAVDK